MTDDSDFSIQIQKTQPPLTSWWIGLSRPKFQEQAQIEFLRMLKHSGDPEVKSIRPMVLGGKLP